MAQLKSTVVQGSLSVTDQIYMEGKALVDLIYPAGSFYFSTNPTNPAILFGVGTWVQVPDKFLFGAGTYDAGTTGGREKRRLAAAMGNIDGDITDARYLINNPSPYQVAHKQPPFKVTTTRCGTPGNYNTISSWTHAIIVTEAESDYANAGQIGTGEDVDFMPPYLVVYIWKRTK